MSYSILSPGTDYWTSSMYIQIFQYWCKFSWLRKHNRVRSDSTMSGKHAISVLNVGSMTRSKYKYTYRAEAWEEWVDYADIKNISIHWKFIWWGRGQTYREYDYNFPVPCTTASVATANFQHPFLESWEETGLTTADILTVNQVSSQAIEFLNYLSRGHFNGP